MRWYVKQVSWRAHVLVTALMMLGSAALLSAISLRLTTAFLLVVSTISLLFPLWLLSIHKFKAKISGPWDEATPSMDFMLEQL